MQRGTVSIEKQTKLALTYCLRHGYPIRALVPAEALIDAVKLILAGVADVLVIAYRGRLDVGLIDRQVTAAGGRIEFVRETVSPPARDPRSSLVADMYRRGATPEQIAQFLDMEVARVVSWLARAGVHRRHGQ